MNPISNTTFIVSAPSGAGKTSLVTRLVAELAGIVVAVSHTTRPRRQGDVDGESYHFTDADTFRRMIADDAFLEHASVFDNYYGTSRGEVVRCMAAGNDVILEIDWQGAEQVRQRDKSVVSVFILPPSRQVLLQRLRGRGTDSAEVVARRTREAVDEMQHHAAADYLLINDDFEQTLVEFKAIVIAERQRHALQSRRHASLIESLLTESE